MNYQEHMHRHNARLERERATLATAADARFTALRVSCDDAAAILRTVIRPELDALAAVIQSAGHECLVKISHSRIAALDTEFEIEISLAAAKSALSYRADPARHLFTVHFQPGDPTPHQHRMLRYDEITPDLIRENCGALLQTAFPQ